MPIDILMPALSPTMEEGTLAKWHVKQGDTVKSGDVIAEIETDKATMEVEAVDEGTVQEILVPEGTEGVKVNAPIARLSGDSAGTSPPPAPKAASSSPEAKTSGEVSPKVTEGAQAPSSAPVAPPPSVAPPPPPRAGEERDARIFSSPLARRIAQQKGLDLATLQGSGPHGRIVKADVEAAQPGQAKAPATPPPAGQPSAAPATAAPPRQVLSLGQQGIPAGSYDLIPLDGMRKTVARRMTESARDVPHFPLNIDVEIDALLAARAKINAMLEKSGGKVSVNDMVIKAAAVALMQVPEANASYTPEGIAMHHHADIAMAVAVPHGLITPIIRAAETKGLAAIAAEAKDLAERARNKKLKPEEYLGGTFSISNLGMFGVKSFSSIINEPQGAILSVGVGEKRPVVRGSELGIATVMSLTLTCDHRVVDGATGARFLAALKPLIEDPITMIV
jgi:pyruvate dehydrogenase E2 component (dihydrolipoamide acetyltransferase)